ncbi:MAG: hypothetical protein E7262_11220 [Lachnospiraceae bacterium]|nr:hypothetical protein [Lachnospiraceae bacterium]
MKKLKIVASALVMCIGVTSVFAVNKTSSKASAVSNNYIKEHTSSIEEDLKKNIQNFKVYYGQIHSHTGDSDGFGTPKEAYKFVKKNVPDIDFFAVTDHSQSLDNAEKFYFGKTTGSREWREGLAAAKEYTDDTFVGLYGYEMTWHVNHNIGHINTYNTIGFECVWPGGKYDDKEWGLHRYYQALKQDNENVKNSVSQFNHPGDKYGSFKNFKYNSVEADRVMNLLEMSGRDSSNITYYCKYYNMALDKGWHVSPSNNQDNHRRNWGLADNGRTVILATSLSEKNIYDAIRHNRTYSTEDSDFKLKYTLDDYVMGSKINTKRVGDTAKIKLFLEDPTDKSIGKVEVVVNEGNVIANRNIQDNNALIEINVPTKYSYYYTRIIQPDGDVIVSAPIWIGYYAQ